MLRDAGIPRRGLSECKIPALHSTLFPQCIFRHSTWKDNRMLKAIHAQENKNTARVKAQAVAQQLREMKLTAAAKKIETGIDETLTYMDYPAQHWNKIRTTNLIEQVNREIKRRTRAIGAFPDGQSALMLVCARLRYVAGTDWGAKRYLNMQHLFELEKEEINEQKSTG